MARTSVAATPIVLTGVVTALSAADAVNGEVVDTGRTYLHVKNGGGSSITVTVQSPLLINGLTVGPLVVTVAAGTEQKIGPIDRNTFGRTVETADIGRAYVSYSSGTSVTRQLFSI